jgi:hypothetical protein
VIERENLIDAEVEMPVEKILKDVALVGRRREQNYLFSSHRLFVDRAPRSPVQYTA